jgi:two-component system, NtrC family, nitrogen regulation sensor histidine kinase NtrY
MRKRYIYVSILALAILLTLMVWQMSFSFGEYGPANPAQTFVFWAVSTLIFLLTATLSFMLFRTFVKLYLDRQSNREGSRIQTKLVLGGLALSLLPVMFFAAFGYLILNRTIGKWFMAPAEGVRANLVEAATSLDNEVQDRATALANWLATVQEVRAGTADFTKLCEDNRIAEFTLDGRNLCGAVEPGSSLQASAPLGDGRTLLIGVRRPIDLARQEQEIARHMSEYNQLAAQQKTIRNLYLLFLLLIALFILFVATWIALLLSRNISRPISALLIAAGEVRRGNLGYRVQTRAMDELATLVRAFNEMMHELEANSRELESRRQFTEAILESIPTGVISLAADGRIQRVNRALHGLLSEDRVARAVHLRDLFSHEDVAEIEYLMKRAQRTGVAGSQIDFESHEQVMHLAVTVSALPARHSATPGFVVVMEDTSELLRAQKAAAWHEVARRIAHELKNPLTPIALCAERIARQLDRSGLTSESKRVSPESQRTSPESLQIAPESLRILRECAATISREVESVKALADEFSQFSRFPAAQPVSCDLNEIVRNALDVFEGRLDGIDLRIDLAAKLPLVNVDPEQFKRVVVNLVDNAAEAMRESLVKRLFVATHSAAGESVELMVADTGCGVSANDKEKLFLPYFSTKGRGTGLGLAIVNHILSDHGARIRVEDNRPTGARFYVEVPVIVVVEGDTERVTDRATESVTEIAAEVEDRARVQA